MDHQQFVETIVGLDENIRFATVCNMSGKIEATKERDGIEKYLTTEIIMTVIAKPSISSILV